MFLPAFIFHFLYSPFLIASILFSMVLSARLRVLLHILYAFLAVEVASWHSLFHHFLAFSFLLIEWGGGSKWVLEALSIVVEKIW